MLDLASSEGQASGSEGGHLTDGAGHGSVLRRLVRHRVSEGDSSLISRFIPALTFLAHSSSFREDGETSSADLAHELVALSKLNFNNTQFDSGDPSLFELLVE